MFNKVYLLITGPKSSLAKKIIKHLDKKKYSIITYDRKKLNLRNSINVKKVFSSDLKLIKDKKVIFINNAFEIGPILNFRNINTNLLGPLITANIISQSIMISLLEKKVRNFYIINISSGAVFTKNKKLSIYTLTKNFIHNLIEYLNIENDKNFIKKKRYINFIPPSFFSKMNQKLIRYNVLKNKKKIKKPDIVAKNLIKLIESLKWD